jgi:hypothetical protein
MEQAEDLVGAFGWARANWAPWLTFLIVGTLPDPESTPPRRRVLAPDLKPGRNTPACL